MGMAMLRILTAFAVVVASIACTESESTPRPTFTPYPTQTPVPTVAPQPTPSPHPTYTPVPTVAPQPTPALHPTYTPVPTVAPQPTPTPYTPLIRRENELFLPAAYASLEEGHAFYVRGDFASALENFKKARELHGKPSGVIESWIATTYTRLGDYATAIEYYSNALDFKKTPLYYTSRAHVYVEMGECALAIQDAKTALAMEPDIGPGVHSDVGAHTALAWCYAYDGNKSAALEHLEASIAIVEEHEEYPESELVYLKEVRDYILGLP